MKGSQSGHDHNTRFSPRIEEDWRLIIPFLSFFKREKKEIIFA